MTPDVTPSEWDAFKAKAQQMIADARARYRAMAHPLIHDALELAIGEVSPEQAIDGLLRWMAQTGRQP